MRSRGRLNHGDISRVIPSLFSEPIWPLALFVAVRRYVKTFHRHVGVSFEELTYSSKKPLYGELEQGLLAELRL